MKRALLPLALVVGIVVAAGCGDDSGGGRLLSQKQARDLRTTLAEVEQDVSAGNCTGAAQQVAELEGQIDSINRLDRKLRSALRSSARRLDTLVSADCETPTTTTPTETTPTTPEEGTTGPSGATGATGDEGESKKPKKEKKVPPGQEKKDSSGDTGGEGGTALPGEDTSGGGEAH